MRFLLDGMLGKLARWLRILGYESEYSKGTSDAKLLSRAKEDSLILLTSDSQLYRNAISKDIESFLIDSQDNAQTLANLAYRFQLKLKLDPMISKCPVCGSAIREASKDDVTDSVPPATFKVHQTFWICANTSCAKIYWQGSHWNKIQETIRDANEILNRKQPQRST